MLSLLFLCLLLALIYYYGKWLYDNRDNRSYFAPLWILALCLLLGGLSQSYVFDQALIIGYNTDLEWFSDAQSLQPMYEGEGFPITIVLAGPIVGLILMLILLPRNMRNTQGAHYTALLLFVYPLLAIIVLVQVGGDRPKFYDAKNLPPIGTRMPATNPNPPVPPPTLPNSERGLWNF